MKTTTEHINRVHVKLQQLLKQFDQLKKENARLSSKNDDLQKAFAIKEDEINRLQQQNLLLKASVTEMNEKDRKKLENQINNYLKNIDNCIAMLSQ